MEGPEHHPSPKPEQAREQVTSVLEEEDVKDFIVKRNIEPNSFPAIKALAQIPKDTIINSMHNFFSFYKGERALAALIRGAKESTADEQRRRMYELFHEFTTNNDEYAARHLVAVLERRSRQTRR